VNVGIVIGNLWATIQNKEFSSLKLLLVQPYDIESSTAYGTAILMADTINSGIGDKVLYVYEGSSARLALDNDKTSCEAVIIGFVN